MVDDSTVYTVGTALRRAQESGRPVELLVEGSWIGGSIAAADGHGVVLDLGGIEYTVIRLEKVTAVRVLEVASPTSALKPLPMNADREAV